MDWDGKNVEQIGYLNVGRAIHPFQLRRRPRSPSRAGRTRVCATTASSTSGSSAPDGTQWASASGFGEIAHRPPLRDPDGATATSRSSATTTSTTTASATSCASRSIPPGRTSARSTEPGTYMPFERPGQIDLTDWASSPAIWPRTCPRPAAGRAHVRPRAGSSARTATATASGKVTQPAAAPGGGDLLLVYTKGPANHNGIYVGVGSALPFYDGGIYFLTPRAAATGTTDPRGAGRAILNDPACNEQWPRPVVPYAALFPGATQPAVRPDGSTNAGDSGHGLAANTPFGLVGSSSMIWRDTAAASGRLRRTIRTPSTARTSSSTRGCTRAPTPASTPTTTSGRCGCSRSSRRPTGGIPNDGPRFSNHASRAHAHPRRDPGAPRGRDRRQRVYRHLVSGPHPGRRAVHLPDARPQRHGRSTWRRPGTRCGPARRATTAAAATRTAKEPLDFAVTAAARSDYSRRDLARTTPLLGMTPQGEPTLELIPAHRVAIEYLRDVAPLLDALRELPRRRHARRRARAARRARPPSAACRTPTGGWCARTPRATSTRR